MKVFVSLGPGSQPQAHIFHQNAFYEVHSCLFLLVALNIR